MSMLGTKTPKYDDGRTKQSFKDETDINKLLKRAQKTGTISHINRHEASYGDFTGYDFLENINMLAKGSEIFDDLPSSIRNQFENSPAAFFNFVNDPANKDRLKSLLPAIAEPKRQNIDVSGRDAAASEPVANANPTAPGATPPETTPLATPLDAPIT